MNDAHQMTVREFCVYKTEVHQLVAIRYRGYIIATAWIDSEDLFKLPNDIAKRPVLESSYGFLNVSGPSEDEHRVPCVFLDIGA